ncbi:MAG: S1 RNA-binding domain-containing protein [Anaerolineae bacterium]|nr:S1 RNA-binding domain-containing protein [Anaerolineae bacterium]
MNNDERAIGQPELEPATDTELPGTSKNEAVEQEPTDEELFLAALNGDVPAGDEYNDLVFAPVKRGQIVKGTIAGKSESEILVDIGVKSEGIIAGREFDRLERETKDALQIGDTISVYVLALENSTGHVPVSLQRALEEQDWIEAEEYHKDGAAYHSKIAGYNKGGLIVRVGKLRGFVPASQVSRERQIRSTGSTPEERWSEMIGEEIVVKVIEVDRARNRLILSERAAAKEWRAIRRTELLASLEVGQVHTGRVISLADFGAFVDLGGADGLVHLSELSWEHVSHPKEVVKIGDEVKVEVINIDRERQRIGLSRKKCLDDPWDTIVTMYKLDQLVQATITKMTKFGVFARLVEHPEIEGLIHISELAERRIEHPREVVEEGQVLTLRVIRIDTERRRIGLSLKQVASEEYAEADWREILETENADEPEATAAEVSAAEPSTEMVSEVETPAGEMAAEEADAEDDTSAEEEPPAVEVASEAEAPAGDVVAEEDAPVDEKPLAEEPSAEAVSEEVVAEAASAEAVTEQASQNGNGS